MWSGERLTRKQVTSRPDHLWPESLDEIGKNAKLKERQKWSHEKPKLDNARKLRGIYFIGPEDKEFKETIKNARKKLETPMAPAMPCKTSKNSQHGVTVVNPIEIKSKLACIWKPVNPQDCVWENLYRIIMKTILQERVTIHCTHYNLVHKFIPVPQAMKIPAAKAAVDKEWEKLEKIPAWNLTKVRSTKRGDRWSKDEGRKSSFCLTDGHLSFKECWIGDKAPKIQRSSCTPRWYCKRRFWILCSVHWTRIISITNDSSKSHGYHIQTARVRRTSSGRSICLYPGKNGRCSKIIENSQIGMSRHLDSSTTTQMAKIMVQYGRLSRSSWAKSVRSSFGKDCYGKGNLRKSYWTRLGEGFQLGMLIRAPWKRVILICVCGWHQIGWKETKHWSDVESTPWKKLIWENQHHSLIMYTWDALKDNVKKSKDIVDNYREYVWIQNFRWSNWKTTMLSKIWRVFLRGPMTWKVMPRNVWNNIVSYLPTKRLNRSPQSINSMHWWPPPSRRRNEICWRIVKYMLSNCSEMLIFGNELDDLIFMVSK